MSFKDTETLKATIIDLMQATEQMLEQSQQDLGQFQAQWTPQITQQASLSKMLTIINDWSSSKPITLGELISSLECEGCLKKTVHLNPAKKTFYRWLSQKPGENIYVIRYISNRRTKKVCIRINKADRWDILSTMMRWLEAKCFTKSANSEYCLKEKARNGGYPATGGNYDCGCSGCRKWWFQSEGEVTGLEHLKKLIDMDLI